MIFPWLQERFYKYATVEYNKMYSSWESMQAERKLSELLCQRHRLSHLKAERQTEAVGENMDGIGG